LGVSSRFLLQRGWRGQNQAHKRIGLLHYLRFRLAHLFSQFREMLHCFNVGSAEPETKIQVILTFFIPQVILVAYYHCPFTLCFVTAHITNNIVSALFLWIIPLVLYLMIFEVLPIIWTA